MSDDGAALQPGVEVALVLSRRFRGGRAVVGGAMTRMRGVLTVFACMALVGQGGGTVARGLVHVSACGEPVDEAGVEVLGLLTTVTITLGRDDIAEQRPLPALEGLPVALLGRPVPFVREEVLGVVR